MPKSKSCPVCADGNGGYYVVVRGVGLERRTCLLPHAQPKKPKTKKAAEETATLVPGGIPL